MTGESRWLLWAAGLLAGAVGAGLVVGVLWPGVVPAEAYRYFDAGFLARARAYSRIRYGLYFIGQVVPILALAAALSLGWDRGLGRWAEAMVGGRPVLAAVVAGGAVSLALTALDLPFGIARFAVDHGYGLSNQTLALWVADLLRSTAINLAIGSLLLAALFWMIRRWPAGWWAPAAVGFAIYLVIATFLTPILIDPLFHRFSPLGDPALVAEVRAMAARAGLPVQEVLVMDASRRTRRINAYFTGFGPTRRIVIYDTLLQSYSRPQVMAILAHEMGHWQLSHIYQGVALGAAGGVLGLWLAQRLLAGAAGRPGDPAQVVMLTLFITLVSIAGMPVQNAISRAMERQADQYAFDLTGNGPELARMEVRLARDNLADVAPHPFTIAMLFTHPPVLERIQAAGGGE